MSDRIFTFANSSDLALISKLLKSCDLPHEDISAHLSHFVVAKKDNRIVGTIGLEAYGKAGLLRSLAVAGGSRGNGIAKDLYDRLLAHAHLLGIDEIYLLTTTTTTAAEGFFAKRGFQREERGNLPEAIRNTGEFQSLCPVTALPMRKDIRGEARYFPKELLQLEPDVPGAAMWGVALEKTMFTYFEVEPGCRFEPHTHESEQITMVLEGELCFAMEGRTVRLNQGEVIAIPSNLPHAVFTEKISAKAVDAWSPVMGKYKKQ